MISADAFYVDLGRRIRDERKQKKISQDELAASCGLTRASIANIEAGRQRLAAHRLCEIATALDTEPAQLLPPSSAPLPATDWTAVVDDAALRKLPEQERAWIRSIIDNAGKASSQ